MNRRMKIKAAFAELRSLLMQEIQAREDVGYPDNLDEAVWALKDSESWYHWTPGAVDAPANPDRRVDEDMEKSCAFCGSWKPGYFRKDAERWAAVKNIARSGGIDCGRRWWSLGALPSESTDVTEAIDAEIKRRSEAK